MRGQRFTADTSRDTGDTRAAVSGARDDAHGWIDRLFDSVEGFMQGFGELVRGAQDISSGRVHVSSRSRSRGPGYTADANIAGLGEWYTDQVIAAETGKTLHVVTNGAEVVECHSAEMAKQVLEALNAQGVKTR